MVIKPFIMAGLNDLPNELLDSVYESIDNIEDAVALSCTSRKFRAWWAASRERHAIAITKKLIPAYSWNLALLANRYCPGPKNSWSLPLSTAEDAVSILAPLVLQRKTSAENKLTDRDLVQMSRRHLCLSAQPLHTKRGHAQLHMAAAILIPQSKGDLDHPIVEEYLSPLNYAMHLASCLQPLHETRPKCRYGSRPDWFAEVALGVMLDLKPDGWWDGLGYHNQEPEVKQSVAEFLGRYGQSLDPELSNDYL